MSAKKRAMWRARVLTWIVGGGFAVILLIGRIADTWAGGARARAAWHCDFANLWTGGQFVTAGAWRTLYDVQLFTQVQVALFGAVGRRVFSYPPTSFPLTQLVAWLPYGAGLILWLAGTATLFALAARHWWPAQGGPAWLAVLTPVALLNINFGQSGFLFGALWLAVFALIERRPVVAGLLIAGFTTKPQLAILIPLILIAARQWRAVAAAAAGSLAWIAASAAIYGLEPWRQFLGAAVPRQAGYIDGGEAFITNLSTSTATVVHHWTGSWPLAWTLHAAVALWALYVLVSAIRGRAPLRDVAMLGATATFLVLPYALAYDLTVPAIAAWAIMVDPLATRTERRLATIGFVAPQVAALIGAVATPILPIALAAQLYAQHRRRTASRALVSDRAAPAIAAAAHSA